MIRGQAFDRRAVLRAMNRDPAEELLPLRDVGFDGSRLDDHLPHMDDDSVWSQRGRAHAIGYMQGLLSMLSHVPASP